MRASEEGTTVLVVQCDKVVYVRASEEGTTPM